MSFELDDLAATRERKRRLWGPQPKPERLSRLELPQAVLEALAEPEATPEPKPDNDLPRLTPEQLAAITDNEDFIWRVGVKHILIGFGENLRRLTSHQRDTHIMDCRKAVAQYLRDRGWSYERIGAFMNRDHSSIINMLKPEERRAKHIRQRDAARKAHAAADDTIDCTVAVFSAAGWIVAARRSGDERAKALAD